jgi:hypothetical protein
MPERQLLCNEAAVGESVNMRGADFHFVYERGDIGDIALECYVGEV